MKKLIIGLTLLSSISSFACINNIEGKLCVGDTVVPDNSSRTYTIKSINPRTKMLQVIRNSTSYRKTISQLGLTRGCMDGLCVGDTVVPDNSSRTYTIKSINPHTKQYQVVRNSTSYRKTISQLGLTRGCMDGLCVGDTVVPDNSSRTYTIKSINPHTKQYQVVRNSTSYRKTISQLGLIDQCTDYSDDIRDASILID